MLNGAHSLLAYAGLDRGYSFVHEAIADNELRGLVRQLMASEAAPTIAAGQGQDLDAYAAELVTRFDNPALNHRLPRSRWMAARKWASAGSIRLQSSSGAGIPATRS